MSGEGDKGDFGGFAEGGAAALDPSFAFPICRCRGWGGSSGWGNLQQESDQSTQAGGVIGVG